LYRFRSFGCFSVNGDAYIGADDGANGAAGAVAIGVNKQGGVITFCVKLILGHKNYILGTYSGAKGAALTVVLIDGYSSYSHTNTLEIKTAIDLYPHLKGFYPSLPVKNVIYSCVKYHALTD
jgi:hypothetical protein